MTGRQTLAFDILLTESTTNVFIEQAYQKQQQKKGFSMKRQTIMICN